MDGIKGDGENDGMLIKRAVKEYKNHVDDGLRHDGAAMTSVQKHAADYVGEEEEDGEI